MNYLVTLRYRLKDNQQVELDEMLDLNLQSYDKHLLGQWEPVVFRGSFSMPSFMSCCHAMFKDVFERLYQLWEEGHNVLAVETDTMCIKPTEIFGIYDQMYMAWATCARSSRHPVYMNAGVVYFPAAMKKEVWELGRSKLDSMKVWDDSQLLLNDMFWSQRDISPMRPELNFSPCVPSTIRIEQAHIVHMHGSRGRKTALAQMRELSKIGVQKKVQVQFAPAEVA